MKLLTAQAYKIDRGSKIQGSTAFQEGGREPCLGAVAANEGGGYSALGMPPTGGSAEPRNPTYERLTLA